MQRKPHVIILVAVLTAAVAAGAGCDKLRARDKLNKGVNAYKNAQFDEAIEDFKAAKEFDPSLTNAQLYLATAYASQYIPGAPSPENIRNGEQAMAEFKNILDADPSNISAIDGIGSILYNMGGTPFDAQKLADSKAYHEKHIALKPDDPEPYYWVGVIDWSLAYRANKDMRDTLQQHIEETDEGKRSNAARASHGICPEVWPHYRRGHYQPAECDPEAQRLRRRHGLSEPAVSPEG